MNRSIIQIFIILAILCLPGISCNNKQSLFESVPASKTNIDFENNPLQKERFGILYYIYYYNGGGVATGDINNDGLPDIYFTANNKAANKLYLNKGNLEFEDITEKAGVAGIADWCSGVTMADVNGDGFLDIYVSAVSNVHGLQGHNMLYINNGNNTFTESARAYGLNFSGFSTQAAFFDYDHDGDLDCYLLNHSERPHANIADTSKRRIPDPLAGDKLFRNEMNSGQQIFTDVSGEAGIYQSSFGYGLGLAIADINNDGWEDIYVGNDFHENDYYYINNGDGSFSEKGADHFDHYSRFSMGNDVADFDNDGHLDIVTVDMLPDREEVLKTYGSDENLDIYQLKLMQNGFQHQYSRNSLQHNNGNGQSFSETALLSGISATDWSWAPLFMDFDNDGKKDLFVSSGIVKRPVDLDFVKYASNLYAAASNNPSNDYDQMALDKMPDGSSHPYFFKGTGTLQFIDAGKDWGLNEFNGYYTGASYADLDNDGDMDIIMNAINAPAVILRNNTPTKNYISISFEGNDFNKYGIGTKAFVYAQGKMQYQQLMLTRGFQSSVESRLHFGLDTLQMIDSIIVAWPGGSFQVLKNIPANKPLRVSQKNASGNFDHASILKIHTDYFRDISGDIGLQWTHKENAYLDFNDQYLIPHQQSTRGPKIAVDDINNDGLDDMYVCGATGQPGFLAIQNPGGSFTTSSAATFLADAAAEDVDAVFFNANGDAYPDLYVVSGGNQFKEDNTLLADRLYLNDGKGNFNKSTNIPSITLNKSCVVAADFDKDGDEDLFIGTLANSAAYGLAQTSHMLLNDGKANFSIATKSIIDLEKIGLVTTASKADFNNDGWPDLLIAGEWMPLTIFMNNQGKFAKKTIPASTGLWQTIFVDDVNCDGHTDFLAGNWGWNNKFYSGKDGPLKMYVGDFDNNKKVEQLVSYTINGKEYPFLAQDEVERQLPLLKKHYLHYADYAGEEMKDVFYGWIDNIEPLTAEILGSAICYGDGKGNFDIKPLPASLQLSPIFSFDKIQTPGNASYYLAGGNFYNVIPYEGRYDAMALSLFSIGTDNRIGPVSQPLLSGINGQVRSIKNIKQGNGKGVIAIARNNDSMIFMRFNNPG